MANVLYPLWKDSVMTELDANNSLDQIGVNAPYLAVVTLGVGGYTYSDSHQYFSSVSGTPAPPVALNNNILVSNIFKADTAVFINVTGTSIGGLIIYRHNSGASSTWRLVLYEDTGITGFPMVPNGGNLLITWNTQGIFAL